jgi:hypothetical protein
MDTTAGFASAGVEVAAADGHLSGVGRGAGIKCASCGQAASLPPYKMVRQRMKVENATRVTLPDTAPPLSLATQSENLR